MFNEKYMDTELSNIKQLEEAFTNKCLTLFNEAPRKILELMPKINDIKISIYNGSSDDGDSYTCIGDILYGFKRDENLDKLNLSTYDSYEEEKYEEMFNNSEVYYFSIYDLNHDSNKALIDIGYITKADIDFLKIFEDYLSNVFNKISDHKDILPYVEYDERKFMDVVR